MVDMGGGKMTPILHNPSLTCETIMYAMWRKNGIPEKTMESFYKTAMDDAMVRRDIEFMEEHFPILDCSIIVDLGCGWGGVTEQLSRKSRVTAIDHMYEHAQGTRCRCPEARDVWQGDVCDLSDFNNESFDIAISRGVIEHIDPNGWRGICLDYAKKQAHLSEMSRVLKRGGHGFISTGNYMFPWDGEVNKYFFSYLPSHIQKQWLELTGETADTYTMVTWTRMVRMLENAGFTIIKVMNHDAKRWSNHMKLLGIEESVIPILEELFGTNPHYMSAWQIIVEKK